MGKRKGSVFVEAERALSSAMGDVMSARSYVGEEDRVAAAEMVRWAQKHLAAAEKVLGEEVRERGGV